MQRFRCALAYLVREYHQRLRRQPSRKRLSGQRLLRMRQKQHPLTLPGIFTALAAQLRVFLGRQNKARRAEYQRPEALDLGAAPLPR